MKTEKHMFAAMVRANGLRLAALLGLWAAVAAPAAQIDTTWLGGTGNWSAAGNWTAGVPNNGGGNTFNAIIDGNGGVSSQVALDQNATIDNLTVNAGDTLTINNGRTLTVVSGGSAGSIFNAGTIRLNSTANNTYLKPGSGPVTLTGGGTLIFSDSLNNWIYQSNNGSIVNVDNTIQGAGHLGWSGASTAITNQGIVVANGTNPLTCDAGLRVFTNTGTLRAAGGGTLRLQGSGGYENAGGTIEALNASVVSVGAYILGGTLQTSGSGEIHGDNGTELDASSGGIQNLGLFVIPNGQTTYAQGTMNNTGTIEIRSTGNNTYLRPNATELRLTGGGTLRMTDEATNYIYHAANGSLVNVDNTIEGAGNLGWSGASTTITNQALVVANAGNPLVCDPGIRIFTNTGTLRATAGATLRLQGSGGYDNAGGTIEALDASVVSIGTDIRGGVLQTSGSGVIHGTSGTQLDASATTIDNAGHFLIPNGNATLAVGTINNTGTIELGSTNNSTYLRPNGAELRLTGGGTLLMSDSPENQIYQSSNGSLVNVDNTIEGAGNLGWSGASTFITNQALVVANAGNPLVCDPGSRVFTNTGTLRATAGATLRLQGSGGYDNAGGTIEALDASTVSLSTMIRGGTLQTAGSGIVLATNNTSLDATSLTINNSGHLRVPDGNTVFAAGMINNTGTIELGSTGGNTYIRPNAEELRLTGGGTLLLSDATTNWIYQSSNGTLFNVDNTIRGAGNLGWSGASTTITNQGTVIADGTNVLSLHSGSRLFDNQGTLRVTGPGGMAIGGGFTTSGTVDVEAGRSLNRTGVFSQTAGLTMASGTLIASQGVDLQGGTLAGAGVVQATVGNVGGRVEPGESAGTLTVTGSYTQATEGELAIEIGGMNTGEFDVLAVSGNAALAGTLAVTAISGFVPQMGDRFDVLTGSDLSGRFTEFVEIGFPAGLAINVEYSDTTATVVIVLRGDMNCDGSFDGADIDPFFLALGDPAAYEAAFPNCQLINGDMNRDGGVDGADIDPFFACLGGGQCP